MEAESRAIERRATAFLLDDVDLGTRGATTTTTPKTAKSTTRREIEAREDEDEDDRLDARRER